MFRLSARVTFPVIASCVGLNLDHRCIAYSQAANASTKHSTKVTPISLKNKNVLITGATAGIGLSCAWRFAEEGANLVLIGRREERLQKIKTDIMLSYPNIDVHTVALSVVDYDNIANLPSKLPEKFKDIDVLVNNAGLALGNILDNRYSIYQIII